MSYALGVEAMSDNHRIGGDSLCGRTYVEQGGTLGRLCLYPRAGGVVPNRPWRAWPQARRVVWHILLCVLTPPQRERIVFQS